MSLVCLLLWLYQLFFQFQGTNMGRSTVVRMRRSGVISKMRWRYGLLLIYSISQMILVLCATSPNRRLWMHKHRCSLAHPSSNTIPRTRQDTPCQALCNHLLLIFQVKRSLRSMGWKMIVHTLHQLMHMHYCGSIVWPRQGHRGMQLHC